MLYHAAHARWVDVGRVLVHCAAIVRIQNIQVRYLELRVTFIFLSLSVDAGEKTDFLFEGILGDLCTSQTL